MTAAGFSPIYSGLGPRASVMSPKQEVSPKLTPKERMISLQGELIIVRRIVEGCCCIGLDVCVTTSWHEIYLSFGELNQSTAIDEG